MKRRTFIAGLGSAAAWPVVARAQQPAMPVIGYLSRGTPGAEVGLVAAFRKGLGEMGYVDGRNLAIEFRWAENEFSRLSELAADLVRRRVAVIASVGGGGTLAAKALTSTIPVVFGIAGDPVELGIVASLNRPGGNATGITTITQGLGPKRLELLHELLPRATRFAVLINPVYASRDTEIAGMRAAAASFGREIEFFSASTNAEIDTAFASLVQRRPNALVITNQFLFRGPARRTQIVAMAVRHALPAIYPARQDVEAGGLMSYGPALDPAILGIYVGRILKGEKPADLPVQQPTKFELVINLKTAKALGLTIPETLLATADEVIQ
jgi:putative tryptophan/tyrosine transport system substrate-binding protein